MDWEAFFNHECVSSLQWQNLSSPASEARQRLQPFLDLVQRGFPIGALPRVRMREGGNQVQWYVGWRHDSDLRFAQNLLRAFLGRTYADMREPLRILAPEDDADRAFALEFQGRAVRLEVGSDPVCREEAREQFLLLAKLLSARPRRLAPRLRPVGRILRDFELALRTGDDVSLRADLHELRSGKHLDEANLAFLDLRRLGMLGAWQDVLRHEALPSLLGFRAIPWQVRATLLSALFHVHLAPRVNLGEADAALAELARLLPEFRVAFSSRREQTGLEAAVCFILVDELRGWPEGGDREADLRTLETWGLDAFAAALRARVPAPAKGPGQLPSGDLLAAHAALQASDLDLAFSLALACPPSSKRAQVLLQCARMLDHPSASLQAVAACDELDPAAQAELFANAWCHACHQRLREDLGALTETAVPAQAEGRGAPAFGQAVTSWSGWFERLRNPDPWPSATAQAANGARDWDVESVASDPEALLAILDSLTGTLPDWATDELRNAIPYLLDAFLGDPPDPRFTQILSNLFMILALDYVVTPAAAAALIRLAYPLIYSNPKDYQDTLSNVGDAVEQAVAPKTVFLVADALELMILAPCANEGERQVAAIRILTLAKRWWHRLDRVDRALLRQLAQELGIESFLEEESPEADTGETPEMD